MSDSSRSDALDAKHRANRAARLEGIKRWVAYIREQPPAVWGDEQNRVVNAQLESARATDVPSDHERRITDFAEAMTAAAEDVDGTGETESADGVDRTDEADDAGG